MGYSLKYIVHMFLITFAHKAEAQEFIKRKHNIPVEFYFSGIYRHEDELLLLTGTGVQSAIDKIRRVIDYYGKKVTGLLNLGIAGALDNKLQINQIYGIRNVYFEGTTDYFTTANLRGQIDCISANKAVTNNDYARTLAKKAQSVDMELWGCAKISLEYNLPLKSYKLISDYAGSDTNKSDIRRNVQQYSRHLFDFYKKLPELNFY